MKIGIEGQRLFEKETRYGYGCFRADKEPTRVRSWKWILYFVKPDEDRSASKETSNFKIIELNGGP
jgi:hypothetical protein